MEKIFYADKSSFASSIATVKEILSEFFGIENAEIARTENGKPFLVGSSVRLFFSVSHTDFAWFFAFSDKEVGIDAEPLDRKIDFAPIAGKFPTEEREHILSTQDFLRYWVLKESAVKWLGGTLARDLKKLRFSDGRMLYNDETLPVCPTIKTVADHLVAVCGERDFSDVEPLRL